MNGQTNRLGIVDPYLAMYSTNSSTFDKQVFNWIDQKMN